jgi:hypothetical protein
VPRIYAKRPNPPPKRAIVIDPERELVNEDVTIGTEAEDILRHIRAVVGTTERLYMASLRIRSRGRFETCSANLARESNFFTQSPTALQRTTLVTFDSRLLGAVLPPGNSESINSLESMSTTGAASSAAGTFSRRKRQMVKPSFPRSCQYLATW